jgi:hypothetical protein
MNSRPGVTATANMRLMEYWSVGHQKDLQSQQSYFFHYSSTPTLHCSKESNYIFLKGGRVLQGLYILDQNTKDSGKEYPHGIKASLVKEIYCFGGGPFCEESLEGKQEE